MFRLPTIANINSNGDGKGDNNTESRKKSENAGNRKYYVLKYNTSSN